MSVHVSKLGSCLDRQTNNSAFDGRLVLAASGSGNKRGIGMRGTLPWPRLREDLRGFAALTKGATVVMGRSTYESLPESARPLPGRLNVVLSSKSRGSLKLPDDVLLAGSMDAAEQLIRARNVAMPFFVIGGADIFEMALQRPEWSRRIYYTDIKTPFECDRFFTYDLDSPNSQFQLVSASALRRDADIVYQFKEYARKSDPLTPGRENGGSASQTTDMSSTGNNIADCAQGENPSALSDTASVERTVFWNKASRHPEMQYLGMIRRIIAHGNLRQDRTGTGTRSLFGETMRFDLRHDFPLLTTKRVFWRGVAEELLWFISGCTDANKLADKGVHIWDDNGSREFLDKRGLSCREVGDLGPVYGFQWRHFGAEYIDMHADYSGKGVDQLANIIEAIKTNPCDRRMVLSAWNPAALHDMALPPCHMIAQFYVANGELSCLMFQRSADMGLGVPFNIASYSLLTCMIAHITGLRAGEFIYTIGDTHVYNNHIDALSTQAQRNPRPFPRLRIRDRAELRTIDDFVYEDLEIVGYEPHKAIKMEMAV